MDRDPGFAQRTLVIVGSGTISRLAGECQRLGMKSPAVLMDPALADGMVGRVVSSLVPCAIPVLIEPGEPTFESVRLAAKRVRETRADGLIAVGGGSTIDTGKLLRGLLAAGSDDPSRLLVDRLQSVLPYVAVPTTAGTGAEMGASAVVTDPTRNQKVLVRLPPLAADVAIADGQLTLSLPPHLTAFTGCDALAQALLAYVSATAESISGQLALRAIDLIIRSLPSAVADGQNTDARQRMMLASTLSAVSMFNSPMTWGCEHIFAESLGSLLEIHHGHLVAAFLPGVAELNAEALQNQYAEVAIHLGMCSPRGDHLKSAMTLVEELRRFVTKLNVPPLSSVVESQPIETLVGCVTSSDAYDANPTPISRSTAHGIILGAWEGTFRIEDGVH